MCIRDSIIKVMYFDDPEDAFDRLPAREIGLIMMVMGAFTLFFFIYPSPIIDSAGQAASVLFSAG